MAAISNSTRDILITAGLDLSGVESGLNRLTSELNRTDSAIYGNTFTHANEMTVAFRNFGGALLNAAEAIPVFGQGIKVLTSGFTDILKENRDINVALSTQAISYDQLAAKLKNLEDLRAEARQKNSGSRLQEIEVAVAQEQAKIAQQYSKNLQIETDAINSSNVAVNERLQLAQIDIERQAKLAEFAQKLKGFTGIQSVVGASLTVMEGIRLVQQTELQEKALKLSIEQQEAQRDVNLTLAQSDVTIQSQLNNQEAIVSSLKRQRDVAEQLYGADSLIASSLAAQLRQAELKKDTMEFELDLAQRKAREDTAALEADIAGNKRLADIYKIQSEFNRQIAVARRAGNSALEQELQKQGALNILLKQAQNYLKSPGERRAERREQRRQDRAIRRANSQDRVNQDNDARGVTNRRSSRDYVSPAAQRARQEFIDRNAKKLDGNTPKIVTQTVGTLVVQQIKNSK